MSQISVNVRLRPLRLGFLVRPNDRRGLLRIFQVNTCLWGGLFNPIIPCFDRVPQWWERNGFRFETGRQILNGYIDSFEPDVLVETEPGLAKDSGFDPKRVIQIAEVLPKEGDRSGIGCGMSVFELYHHLYETEFQFTRRHPQKIVDVTSRTRALTALSACLFGAFPDDAELAYFHRAFTDAFDPTIVSFDADALLDIYQSRPQTPLGIGISQIDVDPHGRDDPALFVFDGQVPFDLLDYWNLRAFGRRALPVPLQWLDQLTVYCKKFITINHRPLPGNPNGVMIRANVMFARSIPSEDIERLYNQFFRVDVPDANVYQPWYPSLWRPSPSYTVREMRPTLSAETRTYSIPISNEKPDITFETLSPDFAEKYGNDRRWANVVKLTDYTQRDQLGLVFPCDAKAAAPRTFGHFGDERPLPTTEGFVVFAHYTNGSEYWSLPTGKEAIVDWLTNKGIKPVTSEAGRATEQIVNTLGGFMGVGSFAAPEIVKLFNEMSRKPIAPSMQYQAFANRINNATKNRLWRGGSFDNLVSRGAVELGLEIKCTKCGNRSWYPLKELAYLMRCALCLQEFGFPVTAPSSSANASWAYRLIGPFALPNYANGGYAAALSLRFFAAVIGRHRDCAISWAAGQELELTPNQKVEADFIVWHQRKAMFGNDHPTETIFGEAKSFGGTRDANKTDVFDDEDVARMKVLATKFPGSIIVFSTMRDSSDLTPPEIDRLSKLANWGREYIRERGCTRAPVIVLTSTELFAGYSLHEAWGQAGGTRAQLMQHGWIHANDVRVLADLTQQVYLNMPSYGAWMQARRQRRIAQMQARRGTNTGTAPTTLPPAEVEPA